MKPGILTTEFWLTIINTGFMILVAFGVVGQGEAENWQDLLGPLVGAIIPIVVYIYSRTQVKKNQVN